MHQRITRSHNPKLQQKKSKDALKIKCKVNIIQADFTELQNAICLEKIDDTIEIIQNDAKIPLNPIMSFNELIKGQFSEQILHAIDDFEYHQPTKIQNEVIPILNEKKQDLIAQSYSYSGQHIAFFIPLILRINKDIHLPQAIFLFDLVTDQKGIALNFFTKLNAYTNIKVGNCIYSEDTPPKDSQILFGTPRSIFKFIKTNMIDVSNVNLLIIKGSDTILDPTFCRNYDAATSLIEILPKTVQLGFFLRNKNKSVSKFVKKMRPNIVSIFTPKSELCTTLEHWYTKVSNIEEAQMIMYNLVRIDPNCKTIIYTPSEDTIHSISDFLIQKGVPCGIFSEDREKNSQIFHSFHNNELNILVVSDGFYIRDKDLVINYQVPTNRIPDPHVIHTDINRETETIEVPDYRSYGRRSTRVGHFGKKGVCFTIVTSKKDENNLKDISSEKQLNFPLNFIDKTQFK